MLFCDLPHDILLGICSYFSVRDVLVLRKVNKHLYALTRDSAVWSSLLRRLTLALPPAQPVLPDGRASSNPTTSSLEYMVSRALRIEHNWKRSTTPFTPAFYPYSTRESIVVWDMAFQGQQRHHVAVAMMHSQSSILRLQTRYALIERKPSLVIAFIRPPVREKTAVSVLSITIEQLHELSKLNPGSAAFEEYLKTAPNPFTRLLDKETRYRLGAISLSDMDGTPILAVVHRPRIIVIYNLETGAKSSLKLGPILPFNNQRHSIWEIKLLPSQKQVFVIRAVVGDDSDAIPFVLELYDLPGHDDELESPLPTSQKLFLDFNIDAFYMSDSDASWNFAPFTELEAPLLHKLADSEHSPPPLSIFFSTKIPRGFTQFLMEPVVDKQLGGYRYSIPERIHFQIGWKEPFAGIILPGAYRSLVWMRTLGRQPHEGISVEKMAVYCSKGYAFSTLDHAGRTSSTEFDHLDNGNQNSEQQGELKFSAIHEELGEAMRTGIRSIQFDEYLGRACLSTSQDTKIHVLDWS